MALPTQKKWNPVMFAGGRVAAVRLPGRYSLRLSTGSRANVTLVLKVKAV